jgi:tRNA(Ile)-lysidine synthase
VKAPAKGGWRKAADLLASALPPARLDPSAVRWADARPAGERWAVALSGGADSVCLLLLVWAHWPKRRRHLCALHFDHRLRGRESAADARFCAQLCRALGVPLVSGRWSDGPRGASEALARTARFRFFASATARRRTRVLWFGHQQDDIAETMLMRLSRGSGSGGLAAPRPVHAVGSGLAARVHVRPLLTLKKAGILAALGGTGAAWREDSSNLGPAHFRNRIRRTVIGPWARASGRDAVAGAALTRELLDEDDQALEAWVDDLAPVGKDGSLLLGRLSGRPRAVLRRALHRWLLLQRGAGGLSRQGFEALLGAAERGGAFRHSLGNQGFALVRRGRIRFEKKPKTRVAD